MSTLAVRQADFIRFLQGGNAKYLIIGVNLLLVVWIASQLATLTWGAFAPSETAPSAVTTTGAAPVRQNPDRQLIGQLPGWHLMGVATRKAEPVATAVPADAPETRLRLTLRGALASDEPGRARAIIADPKGKDEQYSIGDALPGDAELSEIYPDRVILKRNGRYETLRLPVKTQASGGTRQRLARKFPAPSADPQARLSAVRQQLRKDTKSVTGLFRATIHKGPGGEMIGYRISPGRDPMLFEELGLKAGDIVTQVNDMLLGDPANSARALQTLQSGEPITVKLLRDGQEQVISVAGL